MQGSWGLLIARTQLRAETEKPAKPDSYQTPHWEATCRHLPKAIQSWHCLLGLINSRKKEGCSILTNIVSTASTSKSKPREILQSPVWSTQGGTVTCLKSSRGLGRWPVSRELALHVSARISISVSAYPEPMQKAGRGDQVPVIPVMVR